MALPKITQPEFEITLPVIGKKVKFRPFLVNEEKVLLVGKEGSPTEQMNAMIQILKSVVLTKNFNPRDLTTVDMEYLFLHLRAKSINNIVKLRYKDTEDESIQDFELDLNEVQPNIDPDRSNTLELDGYKVELKEPTIAILEKVGDNLDADAMQGDISPEQVQGVFTLLAHCLVKVYDDKEVYDDFTIDEAIDFFKQISVTSFELIQNHFDSAPKLEHTLEYTNNKGTKRSIKLSGIQDFF